MTAKTVVFVALAAFVGTSGGCEETCPVEATFVASGTGAPYGGLTVRATLWRCIEEEDWWFGGTRCVDAELDEELATGATNDDGFIRFPSLPTPRADETIYLHPVDPETGDELNFIGLCDQTGRVLRF